MDAEQLEAEATEAYYRALATQADPNATEEDKMAAADAATEAAERAEAAQAN